MQVYGQQPPEQASRPHPGHSATAQNRVQSREVQSAPAGAQPTDPNKFQRSMAHASFEESMRKAVNPCNRDYGMIFNGWQDVTVQYTLKSVVWWGGVFAFVALLCALGYIWWITETWEARQECFARAAAVLIGQRNTAYKRARFAIEKHNLLADRFDALGAASDERQHLEDVREEIEAGRNSSTGKTLFGEKTPKVGAVLPQGAAPELLEIAEMGDPTVTAQGERVYVSGGVQYIAHEDHKRRVRALEQKITTLRTSNTQFKQRLAAVGE